MKWIFGSLIALLLPASVMSQATCNSHLVPTYKRLPTSWSESLYSSSRKVYKGEVRLAIGMTPEK